MGTHNFWQEYKYQIIGASVGILFHSLLLVVVMGGKGTIAVFLVLFDFPLVIMRDLFHINSGMSPFGVDIFLIVGGTVMYAILGWKAHPFFTRHPELFPHTIEDTHKNSIQHDHQDEENIK